MRIPLLILSVSIGLLAAWPAQAETVIYKLTDSRGHVTFTDKKPEKNSPLRVEEIHMDPTPGQNAINPDAALAQWANQKQQESDQRATVVNEWKGKLNAAKDKLKAAEKALADKQPAEKDLVGIANRMGGSAGARPSEEFQAEHAALEKAVEEARKDVEAVEKAKPNLTP